MPTFSLILSFSCLLIPIEPQKPFSVFQGHTAGPDPETLFCCPPSSFSLGVCSNATSAEWLLWPLYLKSHHLFILLYFFRIIPPTAQLINYIFIYLFVYTSIKYKTYISLYFFYEKYYTIHI